MNTVLNFDAEERRRMSELWQADGLLRGSYALAKPELVPMLQRDWPVYELEIQRNRSQGLFRVPYLLTQSILEASHDPNIVEVVSAALGTRDLVMWGPNIQVGTPNEANLWHTDIESWLWPSVTVVVGLDGCNPTNSTQCIPGTHKLTVQPWGAANNSRSERVLEAASRIQPGCDEIIEFSDFANARFYLFNAKCWHVGRSGASRHRALLLMHYQRASEPRVPYMRDYEERSFFPFPAAYIKLRTGRDFAVNSELHSTENKEFRGTFEADFDYLD